MQLSGLEPTPAVEVQELCFNLTMLRSINSDVVQFVLSRRGSSVGKASFKGPGSRCNFTPLELRGFDSRRRAAAQEVGKNPERNIILAAPSVRQN